MLYNCNDNFNFIKKNILIGIYGMQHILLGYEIYIYLQTHLGFYVYF